MSTSTPLTFLQRTCLSYHHNKAIPPESDTNLKKYLSALKTVNDAKITTMDKGQKTKDVLSLRELIISGLTFDLQSLDDAMASGPAQVSTRNTKNKDFVSVASFRDTMTEKIRVSILHCHVYDTTSIIILIQLRFVRSILFKNKSRMLSISFVVNNCIRQLPRH